MKNGVLVGLELKLILIYKTKKVFLLVG